MRRHPLSNQLISLAVLLAFGSTACRSTPTPPASGPSTPAEAAVAAADKVLLQLENMPPGLQVRLSEGSPGGGSGERLPRPRATKLADADAARLFARLPALVGEKDDRKDFALRDRSQPPPRTGTVVQGQFPPPPSNLTPPPAQAAGKPLDVVRWMPDGEVPLAPNLSITFSQPMIPVTAHADTVARGVPVTLTPTPKGQWRWIGTRTLLFDPEVRFPAATQYTVEIPAGTRSETGAVLKEARRITFATPPATLVQQWPSHGPQRRDALIYARFDQRIDPAAVLATISLRAAGRTYPVRAATADEIAEDATIKQLTDAATKDEQAGRFVVFRPVDLLPHETDVEVVIGPGTPSAEGPRTTTAKQGWTFRTFGPLKIVETRCGWGPRQCPPGTPFSIRFSNPLDEEAFDPAALAISPELPGMKAIASGEWLTIYGRQKGRTLYTVTLPASLRDRFEQTLGRATEERFQVDDAHPQLFGPSGLTLLDPAAKKPTFDVHSINVKSLDLQVYRVEPSDWPRFVQYMEKNPRRPLPPPGKRVLNTTVKIAGSLDEIAETHIDLSAALGKRGKGHVVVHVEPSTWPDRYKPELDAWVQSTDLALDAFVDATEMTAWATRLADGAPEAGVTLTLAPTTIGGTTDARGLATLALPKTAPREGVRQLLIGKKGDDVAFLPENTYYWSDWGGWRAREVGPSLSWFVYDDRHMYKPGETVSVKGWIRRYDAREGGDVAGLGGAVDRVTYLVRDSRGVEIGKGEAKVNAMGGFHTRFALPRTPNLGGATLELSSKGSTALGTSRHFHQFDIQEFRRPEYEVTTTASQGPHLVGGAADVTVKAAYYAGGGLPNAEVNWQVTSSPTSFTPPNRDDYTFGVWVPWWSHRYGQPDNTRYESFQSKTDPTGQHILHMDFVSVNPPRPMSVVAEASVTDVNRQAWASAATLLVHPSALYVGLKRDRYFVDRGTPIEIAGVVVDHDGKAVTGKTLTMKAVRLDWTYKKGEWKEEEVDPQSCAETSAAKDSMCRFETKEGGTYRVTATVIDDLGRPNETQILVWVTGGDSPPTRDVEQQEVTLVPAAKTFAPGDTAELMVQAPFFPAEGLLSIRRSGIVRTESFKMTGPTTTLRVPIEEGHVPNVHVQVDLVGAAIRASDDGKPQPDLPRRPAYARGTIDLEVPPINRTLAVEVAPRAARVEPGGSTTLDVAVRDRQGRPVAGAEMSVIVVDEAVLALSGYKTPDPIAHFYGPRPPGASDYYLRQYVKLSRPDAGALAQSGGESGGFGAVGGTAADMATAAPAAEAAPGAPMRKSSRMREEKSKDAESDEAQAQTPIAVRKNFDALAVFAPEVRTDAAGKATVAIKVPDNLTRYRIMVVAAAGERNFGKGEANVTARLPLMVRPSPPRFLNFGDRFQLPIVVQNQTDAPMTVDVAVRTINLALTDGAGRRVVVPANDRVEVLVPAAAELAGTARLQVGAASGRWADAAEQALPVWTPATTEAFATYGELDKGAVRQPVAMPGDVVTQFGGLEISTSSTQLQALTDAFLYLVQYPFECAEQTSSRVLAVAALRDVLGAFQAEGLPPKAEIERAVARDVDRLRSLQNGDGGFAWWVRGHESWPYISIHGGHALIRAKQKGFKVPDDMLERNRRYLRDIESHIPHWYPLQIRRALVAYSLYVRKRMGDLDLAKAKALVREAGLKNLSMDAIGWLLYTMAGESGAASERAEIHRFLANRVSETAAAANWVGGYTDGNYLILHSDRRDDGILLEAMIEDRPKSDLIPKVVRGLLAHQKKGRWENTQENAFVLLAMDRYFHTYEKVTPDFVSRIWFGGAFAGQHAFKGRTTDQHELAIPMAHVAKVGKGDVIIEKQGAGRLYYRIGMRYAPASLKLDPADHGFAVQRTYEAVDQPSDVVRQADGSWKIKAGARVRVRLAMVAEDRRYHVALVDPLPAGLEAMNPALAVTGSIPQDPSAKQDGGPYWWWYRTWYEHQNLRDERVEAFTSLLWGGVHEYTYVARATTPGTFVVPPTKAEEMYHPETFGRAASDRVIVE